MFRTNSNLHYFLSELLRHSGDDVSVRDVTGSFAIFRILGPDVDETLDKLISPPDGIDDLTESKVQIFSFIQNTSLEKIITTQDTALQHC